MTHRLPLILLTNDYGIRAEGLLNLKTAAVKLSQVRIRIVAQENEQSAMGAFHNVV